MQAARAEALARELLASSDRCDSVARDLLNTRLQVCQQLACFVTLVDRLGRDGKARELSCVSMQNG